MTTTLRIVCRRDASRNRRCARTLTFYNVAGRSKGVFFKAKEPDQLDVTHGKKTVVQLLVRDAAGCVWIHGWDEQLRIVRAEQTQLMQHRRQLLGGDVAVGSRVVGLEKGPERGA